jgi:putative FmdB family regulatory protein
LILVVALYDYLCARCGPFEVSWPIGTAGPREGCPNCGRPAGRTYSVPAVISPARSALNRAREAAERSAHEPRIVSVPPPRATGRKRQPNPLHAKLPRP